MIKHIVMWRLKDCAEKSQNAQELKKRLEALPQEIHQIKALEVGINFTCDATAYDVVLYSEFLTKEDLQIYQDHEEHQKLKQYLGTIRDAKVVVDYEI